MSSYNDWAKRLDAARQVHADFDEVTDAEIPLTPAMEQWLLASPHGAELAYWLGKHPKEAQMIAELNPVATMFALRRIELPFSRLYANRTLFLYRP